MNAYYDFKVKVDRYSLQPWAHHGQSFLVVCYYWDAPPESGMSPECSDGGEAKYLLTEVRWDGGIHNLAKAKAENKTYDAYFPFCTTHCAEMRHYFETTPSERIAGYKVATL